MCVVFLFSQQKSILYLSHDSLLKEKNTEVELTARDLDRHASRYTLQHFNSI